MKLVVINSFYRISAFYRILCMRRMYPAYILESRGAQMPLYIRLFTSIHSLTWLLVPYTTTITTTAHVCVWVCMRVCVCVCVHFKSFSFTLLFLNILVIHVQDIPPPNTKDIILLIPHLILLSFQILLLDESFHFSYLFRTHEYNLTPPTLHRHTQHLASSAVSSYFQFCHPIFCTSGHP